MIRPVSIIILAWNRWALTRRLLDSLERFTDRSSVHVIVVDNGCQDETAEELLRYPWIRVIRNEANLGFVRGNNAALRQLDPDDDVVLLNNDVEILHAEWLERLQATAYRAASVGIAGCRLVLEDGRLLHAGTWIRPDDCWGEQIGSLEIDLDQYTEDRQVEGIVFACAYIKRQTLREVGLLSEEYASYFEDTDYCLRAAAKGYQTFLCGSVTMLHGEHGSTEGLDAFRRRVFERSRDVFRERWRRELESRYRRPLTWQSIVHLPSGYATSSSEMMRALDQEGVRLTYSFAYKGWSTVPVEPARIGDHLLDLIRARRCPDRPDVCVTYAQGDAFTRNRGRYRIGFTMFETDAIPRDWVHHANVMDELWTPTEFGRQAMLASGVKRPVHVIPLGVDVDHFHPGAKRVPHPDGNFVFVANFEWSERKAPELLLRTFNTSFRRGEPVVLVCKILNTDQRVDVPNLIRAMELDENGGRIHLIYNRHFPHYQLATLYRSADCFVSASRGEGWGMPVLEAMACGLPAIATDWGGHTAILDPADSFPLRTRGLVPAVRSHSYYKGLSWAEPDGEHLAQLMRHAYEHRAESRARGQRAAVRVRSALTWKHTAQAIVERLGRIDA